MRGLVADTAFAVAGFCAAVPLDIEAALGADCSELPAPEAEVELETGALELEAEATLEAGVLEFEVEDETEPVEAAATVCGSGLRAAKGEALLPPFTS